MYPIQFAFILFSTTVSLNAYKILIFVPGTSTSQLVLNNRIADLLATRGHQVTLYVPKYSNHLNYDKKSKYAKTLRIKGIEDEKKFDELFSEFDPFGPDPSVMEFIKMEKKFFDEMFAKGCELQIKDTATLDMLKAEQFDIAIAHMYDLCPMGLIHRLGIPTFAWFSSTVFIDHMSWAVGATAPASFVPSMVSSYSDSMTFEQRFKTMIGAAVYRLAYNNMVVDNADLLFRKYFGESFPSVYELSQRSPLVLVNSEELIDFPRPILHKVVYVGGVDMESKLQELDKNWQKIVDESDEGFVLVSFGSIPGTMMPKHWIDAFIQTFSKFPSLTFIWKYEDELSEAARYKNIITTKWIPQKDLLGHPKVKAFITHCGYNSFLESTVSGVPMVIIPLFADQPGNRKRAERLGVGIGIDKKDVSAQRLQDALTTVIRNSSYAHNARVVARMLETKPIKSADLLVRWVEYLAEFQDLTNLQPASIDLNFVEYFLIDVIATFIVVVVFTLYFFFCVTRYFLRRLCCPQKFKPRRNRLGYSFSSE